jgi:hypothetical protein
MLVNKLEAAWRVRVPGGIRPKVTNIPFNGVMGKEIRAMGTKRVPVLANKLFSRNFSSACFEMNNMSSGGFNPGRSNPDAPLYNPAFDDSVNPSYYKDPVDPTTRYTTRATGPDSNKMEKLRLQQQLQDLRRERLAETRELGDLRERDLTRKRIADGRKSYRAYVLDTSKESRGWLREVQGYNTAIKDTRGMLGY